MCGIVGYIGKNNDPRMGLEALKRLEYRGYDSSGMAVFDEEKGNMFCARAVGKIAELEKKVSWEEVSGSSLIMQTRWATHGAPNMKNAHPHTDCKKNIYLVHNGIIENHKSLKDKLIKKGHKFSSQTDTEVLPHLIEEYSNEYTLEEAVRRALQTVRGTYGIAVISKNDPGKIVAARMASPLLIGVGDGEYMVASDPAAVLSYTNKVIYLEDGDIAVLTKEGFRIADLKREVKDRPTTELEWGIEEAQKG